MTRFSAPAIGLQISTLFGLCAIFLFLFGLLENWLSFGIVIPYLSIANNSGLVVLSIIAAVLYFVSKKVESNKETYY